MSLSLQELRKVASRNTVHNGAEGFSIERRDVEPETFNRLVREAVESSGQDFVAFPQTDGHRGYSALYVLPF